MESLDPALITRLDLCADRLGGKRALATASQISEAQLYRYMGGESAIPHDRLLALAQAAKVDAGWLLTGHGTPEGPLPSDPRPPFRPALLTQIIQVFEELLVEYDKPFTPRQRARAITFMYEALRHEEVLFGTPLEIDRARLISVLHYLGDETFDDALQLLSDLHQADQDKNLSDLISNNPLWTIRLTNLVSRCSRNWHDSYSGEAYFQRMGIQLIPKSSSTLLDMVKLARKYTGKNELRWLDTGCGNGRELSFLFRHVQDIQLKGLEISSQGCRLAKDMEASSKLPTDSVLQGDFRSIPFNNDSFDVIYSRMSLFCTPYLPQSNMGAEEFFNEATRVLAPSGLLMVSTVFGEGRNYLPLVQYHTPQTLKDLAQHAGLETISIHELEPPEGGPSYLRRPCLSAIFKKI